MDTYIQGAVLRLKWICCLSSHHKLRYLLLEQVATTHRNYYTIQRTPVLNSSR